MKKSLVVLGMVSMLVLAGCNSSSDTSGTTPDTSVTPTTSAPATTDATAK